MTARSVSALLLVASCTPALRVRPPLGTPPLRHALGSPLPRTVLRVEGVELALHDSDPGGSRPALLCLHAIGHGGADFAGLEAAFGNRYRVLTLDWPGQGYSGDDREPASAKRYTQLLGGVIDALGLERVVLIGNSIGGAAAIAYAAAHPDTVRGLVLANPGGLDPGGLLAGLFIGNLVRHFEAGAREEAGFADWFRGYYGEVLITPAAAAQREAIIAAGYESAPVLAQAWRSFATSEANLTPLLPRLTMPTLVAWAKEDNLIRWSRNKDAVAQLPRAEVRFFEAGHAAFLEAPEAFNAALESFLSGLRTK